MSGEPPERSQEEGTTASALNQPAGNALVIPSYVARTGNVLALLFILSSFKSGKQVVFSLPQASTCVPLPENVCLGNCQVFMFLLELRIENFPWKTWRDLVNC